MNGDGEMGEETVSEFSQRMKKQIEKNNRLIGEARQTVDEMRAFFRSLGADLDSGRNIFLESPLLSKESRRQAEETIKKMEEEMKAQYQEYKKSSLDLPGQGRPEPFPGDSEGSADSDSRRRGQSPDRGSGAQRRSVRKMRL
jgi:hypothetical protein